MSMSYADPEKRGQGTGAMMALLGSRTEAHIPFAPPFLKDGELILSQVANILMYLGPKLGLAPRDEGLRHVANGLQLTIADCVAEVHDTHHPIANSLYYEDQKEAAKARSADFLANRMPKFLGYFERVLRRTRMATRTASEARSLMSICRCFNWSKACVTPFPAPPGA